MFSLQLASEETQTVLDALEPLGGSLASKMFAKDIGQPIDNDAVLYSTRYFSSSSNDGSKKRYCLAHFTAYARLYIPQGLATVLDSVGGLSALLILLQKAVNSSSIESIVGIFRTVLAGNSRLARQAEQIDAICLLAFLLAQKRRILSPTIVPALLALCTENCDLGPDGVHITNTASFRRLFFGAEWWEPPLPVETSRYFLHTHTHTPLHPPGSHTAHTHFCPYSGVTYIEVSF
jgi:hypothetical protein